MSAFLLPLAPGQKGDKGVEEDDYTSCFAVITIVEPSTFTSSSSGLQSIDYLTVLHLIFQDLIFTCQTFPDLIFPDFTFPDLTFPNLPDLIL